jgi:beta-carotene/zeaxanthin 4-ketolase
MNLVASNPTTQTVDIEEITRQNTTYGILIASCVILLWAASLITFCSLNLAHLPVWFIPAAVLWQMFLYTGLFITAHDAMHGSVYPQSAKINHLIGSLAVLCYGLFPYKELLRKHWLHHRYPASDQDPDFHDGKHSHPVHWYFYFMSRYWSWKQFVGLTIIFHIAHGVLHIPILNLFLFWIVPSILSSLQLFYFGTFLTHQEPAEGFKNSHRAQTNPLPVFWSFITCYHFGYHEEHHEYPYVSWWRLPEVYKMRNSL